MASTEIYEKGARLGGRVSRKAKPFRAHPQRRDLDSVSAETLSTSRAAVRRRHMMPHKEILCGNSIFWLYKAVVSCKKEREVELCKGLLTGRDAQAEKRWCQILM
jgi:hypothetical protein